MSNLEGASRQDTDEKYSRMWFAALAKFHHVKEPSIWQFDDKDVIEFLRSKVSEGMPTWKRLKIVQGLIWYRNSVRKSSTPRLERIRTKLREMIAKEKERCCFCFSMC